MEARSQGSAGVGERRLKIRPWIPKQSLFHPRKRKINDQELHHHSVII
jgi:hypothetical protein